MLVSDKPVDAVAILPAQTEKVKNEESSNNKITYVALGFFSAAALAGIYYGVNYLNWESPIKLCLSACNEKSLTWIADWSKKRQENTEAISQANDEERALLYKAHNQLRIDLNSKVANCIAECRSFDYSLAGIKPVTIAF